MPTFDADFWDKRYSEAPKMWSGHPNPHLVSEVSGRDLGAALEVGAGEGADAIWLAENGWAVTAVDISAVALDRGRAEASTRGHEIAGRIEWQQADLAEWAPAASSFDLVTAQFMQLPGELRVPVYQSLAAAVALGGMLLVVAHHPSDMQTSVHRPNSPDLFFTAEQLVEEMGAQWAEVICAKRPRTAIDADGREVTIHDTVLIARR